MSFAVDALRRIGGFDPGFGHVGARVFFSEEDQAERALARLGYRIVYAPDAAVEHVIAPERVTRAAILRRRFAYGRTLGMRGARGRALALRQASVSGAGAIAALARGDGRRFMERAARASVNAGVLAGSRSRRTR